MREFMVRADISAIFLLIAGSMTPVYAILFDGISRWLPLVFIWVFALAGILLRMVFYDVLDGPIGISIFLMFGWTGVFIFVVLWRRLGWNFVQPAFYGGVAYTLGALVLLFQGPTFLPGVLGPHEFWHLAVLGGLACHWKFVFQFAAGPKLIPMASNPEVHTVDPACLRRSVLS
jgi:channel protein (hemolysin III family)